MKKEDSNKDLFEIITSSHVVPGIYNYCDRWCILCHSRMKCALYVQNRMIHDCYDEENEDEPMCIMEVTRDFLQELVEEIGIEWEDEMEDEMEDEPDEETDPYFDDLNRKVASYAEASLFWVQYCENVFVPEEVEGAMFIIGYYSWVIMLNIQKATVLGAGENNARSSQNGFVKVALVSMEKSQKSLTVLYEYLPDHQDEILSVMKQLSVLIREVEHYFPHARTFVRPGLDD